MHPTPLELRAHIAGDVLTAWRRVLPAIDSSRPGGWCLYLAGLTVAAAARHDVRLVFQAGSASWPRLPLAQMPGCPGDDGERQTHFAFAWEPNSAHTRRCIAADVLPEMHVWAGHPERQEVVDLSTSTLPELCTVLTGLDWPGPRPPPWLWYDAGTMSPWTNYVPNARATTLAASVLPRCPAWRLCRAALR